MSLECCDDPNFSNGEVWFEVNARSAFIAKEDPSAVWPSLRSARGRSPSQLVSPAVRAGKCRPCPGFSLVELLVVIMIIWVLIALLMPTVITAQRHAYTVQCASNLRQIGMALQSYAGANHGWLPAWSAWHTWPAGMPDDSSGPAWTIELAPYIGHPDSHVYNCPAFPSRIKCRNYFLAAQWAGKSNKNAMKLTDVILTGRFVLSGDKTQIGLYPRPFGTNTVNSDDADPDDFGGSSDRPVLAWPWDPGGFYMHPGGNNVLFDDTHVALFSRYDPYNMTFNPHRMEDWFYVTSD